MVPLLREEDVAIEKKVVSQSEYVEAVTDPRAHTCNRNRQVYGIV